MRRDGSDWTRVPHSSSMICQLIGGEQHGVNNSLRGAGWWRWKPYYLLHELRKVREGDVLVHADHDLVLAKSLLLYGALARMCHPGWRLSICRASQIVHGQSARLSTHLERATRCSTQSRSTQGYSSFDAPHLQSVSWRSGSSSRCAVSSLRMPFEEMLNRTPALLRIGTTRVYCRC